MDPVRGDKLLMEAHHRNAAATLAALLDRRLSGRTAVLVVSIAGESGSGKSELASALAAELHGRSIPSIIIQQDDYFVYPPKTNDRKRRSTIRWVGPQEVRLDLLDRNLEELAGGSPSIVKPLVYYDEDRIAEEELTATGVRVVIVEGTYTSLLENVDVRVFIDRTYRDTRDTRIDRAREAQDRFLDRVLRIEHEIISSHKDLADILIASDYSVKELVRES
jgi:uridine kinase